MKVGFTGTQKGMTKWQSAKFLSWLMDTCPDEFHHGCCIGADEQAAGFARIFSNLVVGHPPIKQDKVSHPSLVCSHETRPRQEYLVRNRAIVDETDMLVATPGTFKEIKRSGTWATIRYARKKGKPILIVEKNGALSWENT